MSALLRDYLNFVKEQSPIRPEKQAEAEGGPAKPACNRLPKARLPKELEGGLQGRGSQNGGGQEKTPSRTCPPAWEQGDRKLTGALKASESLCLGDAFCI